MKGRQEEEKFIKGRRVERERDEFKIKESNKKKALKIIESNNKKELKIKKINNKKELKIIELIINRN